MTIGRPDEVTFLLLLSCAAPLMTCVTREVEMNAAERNCCRYIEQAMPTMWAHAQCSMCAVDFFAPSF